jgi:hypothetical protein
MLLKILVLLLLLYFAFKAIGNLLAAVRQDMGGASAPPLQRPGRGPSGAQPVRRGVDVEDATWEDLPAERQVRRRS